MSKLLKKQKSSALLNAIVFLSILVIIAVALVNLTFVGYKYIRQSYKGTQALDIAEAGTNKALFELNKPGSTYTGETDTAIGDGTFSVQVTNVDQNTKTITSTGYLPNSTNYQIKRIVRVTLYTESSSTKIAFNYATQIGDLGLMMNSNAVINGTAYSNGNITGNSNAKINGDAWAYGTISSPSPIVSGTKHPSAPKSIMPTVDYNFWKNAAAAGGTNQGDYNISGTQNLGPLKINGNLNMNSNCVVTLKGPVYVTGGFNMNSNSKLYLDSSFGSMGTVLITDGTINLNSNAYIYPTSATPKGYVMLVSTNSSNAINLNSNSSNAILYALNGTIIVNSNGKAKVAVGKGLTLNSNAQFDYDAGLASAEFTTGPGGAWVVKPGSWQKL